jgi:hypothetical protein
MNRQARVVADIPSGRIALSKWHSYGNVGFFDAVRKCALATANPDFPSVKLSIEVRDEHDAMIPPAVYKVEVVREVRILNPRRDADVEPVSVPSWLGGLFRRIRNA